MANPDHVLHVLLSFHRLTERQMMSKGCIITSETNVFRFHYHSQKVIGSLGSDFGCLFLLMIGGAKATKSQQTICQYLRHPAIFLRPARYFDKHYLVSHMHFFLK